MSCKNLLKLVGGGADLVTYPRQLHKICNSLYQYGVGSKVTRSIWGKWEEDCFYTITKVSKPGMNSVKAWGYLTFRGKTTESPIRLRSSRKSQWTLVEN
eukprot:m.43340 g.43340  ORF g.43340 m.43340 type:complete len:99 (-) comp10551_c0_seq4:302-598(-)